MRILIIADVYPHAYKTYYDTHFTALADEGHELSIYSLARPFYVEDAVDPASLRYKLARSTRRLPTLLREVPGAALRFAGNVVAHPVRATSNMAAAASYESGWNRQMVSAMRAVILQAEQPDICMLHGIDAALWLPWLKHVFPTVPIALYFHGSETPLRKFWDDSRLASGFAAADVVITNSSSSARNVIGRGCPEEKLAVIPLGFRLEEYVPPATRSYRRDGKLRLLTAARQSPEKGHVYALQALKLLLERGIDNFHYRITGEGPSHGELAAFVSANGLEPYVTFTGKLPREAVPQEMAAADMLLQPSLKIREWEENQACAVQEAMLMKTLVLTTTEGGVRECIAPEMISYCVPQADPEAIAAVLQELAVMPPERLRELGEKVRAYAESHFEVHEQNQRMIDVTLEHAALRSPTPSLAAD